MELTENSGEYNPIVMNFLKSIREDEPLLVSDLGQIEFYNQQQIMGAFRFVYSNSSDFSLAKETVKAIPEIKNNTSTVKLNGLGKAPQCGVNIIS